MALELPQGPHAGVAADVSAAEGDIETGRGKAPNNEVIIFLLKTVIFAQLKKKQTNCFRV